MEHIQSIDLKQMRNVDIRTVERDSLRDINDIQIDKTLPREQRLVEFIRQIGNPYCYRCGKAVVKVSFSNTDVTLEDRFEHFLKR